MDTYLFILFGISFIGFIIGVILLYKLLTADKKGGRHVAAHR